MIDQAIERFDLLSYVRDRGAVESQSGEWVLFCPVCAKEKLAVNVSKKTWHCWVCQKFAVEGLGIRMRRRAVQGAGGLLDLIQLLESCDRKQAIHKVLAAGTFTAQDLAVIGSTEFTGFVTSYHQSVVPIPAPPNWRLIDAPLPYMMQRGITMEDVQRLGIFYCDQGRYGNRLVFPVWEDGALVYWQARAMWESDAKDFLKALNPPKQTGAAVSSDVLMNLNTARFYPRVCIVEGPVDCVHAGPDAVASFGKAISAVQIAKLYRAGVRSVDLMWDADAREAMLSYAPVLATVFDVRLVWLPEKDPGTYPRHYLQQLRAGAQPYCQGSVLGSVQ